VKQGRECGNKILNIKKKIITPPNQKILPHLTMGKVPEGRMGKGEKICALRYR